MPLGEEEKKKRDLPYEVEALEPEPRIIETDVQLSRDIMRVDSRTCVEFVPVIENEKLEFVPTNLPYPEALNDDISKSYLKEEELVWARMQLNHIYNTIRFAQDYGLYLPYIIKQISQLQAFLAVTRSRNMAAAKLSKTTIHWEEARTSQWLTERAAEEAEKKRSLYERIFGKKASEDKFFESSDRLSGINL